MKINNTQAYNSNYRVPFGQGFSFRFQKFVEDVKPFDVENYFSKKGINAHFSNSKPVAAFSYIVTQIFENLGLTLPKKITTVNKFSDTLTYGLADTEGRITFPINPMKNLHSYEEFLEDRRKAHVSPTAHVLGCFLHEFAHIQNFSNMEKLGRSPNETVSKIRKIPISEKLREYISNRYDYDFRRDNLLDLFAEIVEKRLADGLDSETLLTNKNPFSELKFSEITPLHKQRYSNECDRDIIFNRLLNGIYEGDLKKIKDNYSYFA